MRPRPGRAVLLCAGLVVSLVAGCDRAGAPTGSLAFREVAAGAGLALVTTSGCLPWTEIVEAKGGGVALFDHDGDGDLDVFAPNGATLEAPSQGPGCRLFENRGELAFQDVTAVRGLAFRRWGMGVAVGDVNGDARDDLYVTVFGPDALLLNGATGFTEADAAGGVGADVWSMAAAFGDLDRDGDLDLYVANYLRLDLAHPPAPSTFKGAPVFTGPRGLPPEPDHLYENLGDGRFLDVSESSGCRAVEPSFGLGCAILDFDDDGRLDVFVGNDSTPNRLFAGRGGLHFEEVGLGAGLSANVDGSTQATMGIAVGDVNADGRPDIFTTNFSNDTNTLHVQGAGGFYDDRTRSFGLGMAAFARVGWAAGFQDFDQDGDEDLLVLNGHVYANATPRSMDSHFRQAPLLYERVDGRFVQVTSGTAGDWLDRPGVDRGAAFGDLDGDGDVDAVLVELNGPLRLLENVGAAPARSLRVELPSSQWGARVEIRHGEQRATRWVASGGSFLSASARVAHFGLWPGCDAVDLVVTWVDGTRTERRGVRPGHLSVRPGE